MHLRNFVNVSGPFGSMISSFNFSDNSAFELYHGRKTEPVDLSPSLMQGIEMPLPPIRSSLSIDIVADSMQTDDLSGGRRKREKVGRYKRNRLSSLLQDGNLYERIDSVTEGFWPLMNTVYYCKDWRTIDSQDPHCLKKRVGFSQGSYTQSKIKWGSGSWEIRQSRCNGVRQCQNCGKLFPRSSRRKICGITSSQAKSCTGKIVSLKCFVTLYYLFPSESNQVTSSIGTQPCNDTVLQAMPSDSIESEDTSDSNYLCGSPGPLHQFGMTDFSRIVVCIPDVGHDGHSHNQVLFNPQET